MKNQSRNSFTLIELLVVMAIIAILTAITLGVAGVMQNKAARARAGAEIAAMSTGLDSYKLDNGAYPGTNGMLTATASTTSSSGGIAGATALFTSLNGGLVNMAGTPTAKVYMTFRKNQLSSTVSCYVQDPFGYPYGYVTNGPSSGMNPGMFDLWSTSGKTDSTSMTNGIWMNNWSAN